MAKAPREEAERGGAWVSQAAAQDRPPPERRKGIEGRVMNFRSLFTEYHVDYKLGGTHKHVRQGFIGLDCPWCGPGSHRYHLGINLAHRYAVCWRGGRASASPSCCRGGCGYQYIIVVKSSLGPPAR